MGHYHFIGILGVLCILSLAYLLSRNRSAIRWTPVAWGLSMQVVMSIVVLRLPVGRLFFEGVNKVVLSLLSFQEAGSRMVFGALAISPGGEGSLGFFLAFQALTAIIFFSALISVLYYFGIMQWVMMGIARVMRRCIGTSGAETLSASANVFIGQTEAPLLVRPYIKEMTQSELLCIMIGGMATVAGGVMGAYVGMLKDFFPSIAGHLLSASLMSAPGALAISKILIPETGDPVTKGTVKLADHGKKDANVLEAVANGAQTGLQLALNVATMLIAFVGLLGLSNALIGKVGAFMGFEGVSIQSILGFICAPLAFLMGTPWEECLTVGQLIGEKTTLSELVAYLHFGEILRDGTMSLSPRSMVIVTYAITGFANVMSVGIQIGGIGAIVPERKSDLARLGILALIGGSLVSFINACIAGVLTPG